MNNILIFIFVLLSSIFSNTYVSDNNTPNNDADNEYLWPTNASNTITTVFGDERSRRFHAGIDVRTYGIIGKEIYAIESGYVSRIKISPNGYGKTIYFTLDDGNTALYAHLDKFNPTIEEKSLMIQKETKNSFIDNYLIENELRFSKGDIIGYSGDTGSISGPHLHFEIRNKNGKPINPLQNYFSIEDTLKPIANSLAFIPLNRNSWINGIQDYVIFNLNKINDYKYVLVDTVSTIGNFGIAIETLDKINNQNFDYGIYQIELLIDNKLIYKLKFEKYDFKQDPLIYQELDFSLLNKFSKKYHKLFNNKDINLDFIYPQSLESIILDQNYHNLIINISDINNNKIQVQGVLKGDIITNSKLNFNTKDSILFSKSGFQNLIFNYTTRYQDSKLFSPIYEIIDSQNIFLQIPSYPYHVLEYYLKEKNGLNSKIDFLNLVDFDPMKIDGEINIKHLENGIILEFKEKIFSGCNAIAILKKYSNKEEILDLSRNKKNILSTKIIEIENFSNVKEIIIKYNTFPEKIFKKSINGEIFKKDTNAAIKHNNFIVYSNANALFENIFLAIEDTSIIIDPLFKIIGEPIKITPENISFKNNLVLLYENEENNFEQCAIYNYDKKNNKWFHMEKYNSKDSYNENNIKTKIYSGGIFAVFKEQIKPKISNISPSDNATYKSNDIDIISFKAIDKHSKINYENIIIKIDNNQLFYEFLPYRDLVRCNIKPLLNAGTHTYEIFIEDRVGNSITKKGHFKIE